MELLKVEDLTFTYPRQARDAGEAAPALEHVSFQVQEGGYIYESGEYARETSLVLTLIDVDKTVVKDIAKDLCAFFHQESVLVTESHLQAHFVRETLECGGEETL